MIKDIHIFKPGVQTSAQGVSREFTVKDLQQVVDSYHAEVHEAPILVGHEMNDKVPAFGWVKGVKMKGEDLYAEVEFTPQMEQFVRDGLYKKVSASFYSPESQINPEPGNWSLRHVAMLGAQPPAVKGLKGFAYSEESTEEGVQDFASELNLESVFDEELGPTIKSEHSPIELLKEKLDEARAEMSKEQQITEEPKELLEEQTAGQEDQEFAEKKKPAKGKMGSEDAEEEVGEDEVELMEDEAKHGEGCSSKKKKGSNYEEGDVEVEVEVKKDSKKSKKEDDDDDDMEMEEAQHGEPTFEASKKKRGTDNLDSSDVGVKETPESKIFEASEEEEKEEDEEDEDEAAHGEVKEPSRGADGMKGRPKTPQNDQSGRDEVGKAGPEGETGRKKVGKQGADGDEGREETGSDDGDMAKDREKGAKNGKQDADRKKVGKAGKAGLTGRGMGKDMQFAELEARLAQLETANARLVQEKITAERTAHRLQLEDFAESLYSYGKLTPAIIEQDELVDYMEGLEYGTLEFAEGETAASKLMALLASLPSQVSFSEIAGGQDVEGISYDALDPHEKALHIAKEEGVDYTEALKRALFTVE